MNFSDQKKELRSQQQKRLERIPFFELIEKSGFLRDRFLNELIRPYLKHVYQKAVVSFYPFDAEAQINIEEEGQNEPYSVAYVRIESWSSRTMKPRHARRDQPGQWEDIEPLPGVRIFQPTADQAICSLSQTAVILVPALALSRQGERLGRGAGFYDRFLKEYPEALRVGVGLQEQILDSVPMEPWDEPMDLVITDQGFFPTNRFGEWQIHGKVNSRASILPSS